MVAVYGRPWVDLASASALLERYLDSSGFLLMDVAARAGQQPLGMPDAEVQPRDADEFRTLEDVAAGARRLITAETGWTGRVATLAEPWNYAGDPGWEKAAMLVGGSRVLQFGTTGFGDAVAARMLWSGVDLPARAAAGDGSAREQLKHAVEWMLGAAGVGITGNYGRPNGTPCAPEQAEGTCATQLDSETAISTFRAPTSWRVRLKVASEGVLFKERYHPQWSAYQVTETAVAGEGTAVPLEVRQTVDGHMYVTLPPSARIVDFVLERHPLETASRGISAVAAFVTIAVSFFLWRRR